MILIISVENQINPTQNQPSAQPEVVTTPESPLPPIKPKKAWKKWVLIVILVILIIGLPMGGYLVFNKIGVKPKLSTVTVQNTKPTPIPDPTANWKTYNDLIYDFELKYPEDWEVKNLGAINFYSPDYSESGGGSTFKIESGIHFSYYVSKHIDSNGTLITSEKSGFARSTELQIGSNKLLILTNSLPSKESKFSIAEGFLTANGLDYTFNMYSKTNQDILFNKILSTFKFKTTASPTPTLDASTWKTYTDIDYPFQIKYPSPGWTIRTTYGKSVNNTGNDRVAGIDINTGTPGYGSVLVINIIDSKGKSLEDWLRLNMSNSYVPTKINFQGNTAYRYQYPTQDNKLDTVEIYYKYKDKIVFFAWNLISGVDQPTADQIMSTFKFTQ